MSALPAESTLAVQTAGQGSTPVVLLHGNFASWRWWKPLLDAPPKGLTLHAATLPGFGGTQRGPRPHSVPNLASELREWVRRQGLEPFHLVGHSLGGAVALQYALEWPESLYGLSLVAPAPADGLEQLRARSDAVGQVLRWTDPVWLSSRVALTQSVRFNRAMGTWDSSLARMLTKMMPAADPSAVDFDALVADAAAVDETVLVDVYESLRRWDVRDLLPRLRVPVRVLAGRQDGLLSVASVEAFSRLLPGASLEIWEEVGHSPQLERPQAFAAWLGRLRVGPFSHLAFVFKRVAPRVWRALRQAMRWWP
jgi:pimeloyl-ACP methyl ester carboxylesterase